MMKQVLALASFKPQKIQTWLTGCIFMHVMLTN